VPRGPDFEDAVAALEEQKGGVPLLGADLVDLLAKFTVQNQRYDRSVRTGAQCNARIKQTWTREMKPRLIPTRSGQCAFQRKWRLVCFLCFFLSQQHIRVVVLVVLAR
jgi:hypothetical protein